MKQSIRFVLLTFLVVGVQMMLMAQENCYETQRRKGIQLYNQGDYTAAYKNFEAAKSCTDLPTRNDLNAWMEKCRITVNVSTRELTFNPFGGEEKCVEVTTNARSFNLSEAPDWCTMIQDGKMLYLSCEDNFTTELREARITVTAGGKTTYFDISQASGELNVVLDPDSLVFNNQGETKLVTVTTNASDWRVESVPEWIVAVKDGDSLSVTSSANALPSSREAMLMLFVYDELFPISVMQMGADTMISVMQKEIIVSSETDTTAVEVTTNVSRWKAETTESWIMVECEKDRLVVVTAANPSVFSRHGKVKISAGSQSQDLEVHQYAHVSSFEMPVSELSDESESTKESIMVTSVPSNLRVYIDDSISRITPFSYHVDYEHHSLLVGFERREYLFNDKQSDITFTPGLRFAEITFSSPKIIGLKSGYVSANHLGAYAHFQMSRPVVKDFADGGEGMRGYRFTLGPVYQPIQYVGVYAGVGLAVCEGSPKIGFGYEAGVMGFYQNVTLSMGFHSTTLNAAMKETSFVFGIGGYLKRYYDKEKGYCTSDSRRWWSLNYVARPAQNGKGVMFGDLGSDNVRTYLKAMYLQPEVNTKNVEGTIGVVFTPVGSIIDLCMGVGANVNINGSKAMPSLEAEMGTILNLWRIPVTIMLHESSLLNNRHLYVDFGVGFHLGKFNQSSYK